MGSLRQKTRAAASEREAQKHVPNPTFPSLQRARPSVPSADTLGERRARAERGKRPEAAKLGGRQPLRRRRRRSGTDKEGLMGGETEEAP